jgi:cystathionine beta-lyase
MDLMLDLDQPIDRRGTDSYKWDGNETLFGRADLLPFWVADMDFATPRPILDAIRNRLEHPVLGYELRSGEYCSAICDWLHVRHGWDVPQEWLVFCPSGPMVGIQGLVEVLSEQGDSIAVPTPTYSPLLNTVVRSGRRLIRNPLREVGGRFEMDSEDLERKLQADTKVVLLCSPHNPVGRVYTREELQTLADIAEKNYFVVVSDEVHCDLVMPGHRHIPYGMIGGERSVTVVSPNKTFNSAGIPQSTFIIPNHEIRTRLQFYLDRMQLNLDSTFGALGMIAGYRQCGPWLDAVIAYVDSNHRLAADYFHRNQCGVRKLAAEATYLAWLDFRETGLGQEELLDRLVNIGGIGLYRGTEFGEEGRGFFRMNLACPRSLLEMGLEGISKALQ